MARKFTDVFDDKILESKKPAGCIGGIFQLFGCQQFFHGRQLSEQGNRRDASAHDSVCPSISSSSNLEKNQSRRSQDNTRYSMESSRTSFSSTFTTFSSLEHKSPQEESINTQHTFLPGSSPMNSSRTRSAGTNKSPDFKEAIRESIYRDLCSAKTKEDNKRNKVFNSIHSPRPMEQSKDRDLNESFSKMLKFKVCPERFSEGRSPRFSYDGTEMSRILIDMKEYDNKHNGLSRLSLDSRECSLRCNLSPKINSAVKESDTDAEKRAPATLNQLQDLENNEKNSSIVAKIMGLEPLNSAAQNSIRSYDPYNKQNQVAAHEKTLRSPRNIAKPPRRNNPHLDLLSKFSNEETPQILIENVEAYMNQKIESVFKKAEKRIQKLPCQHSCKELQDIKRVISATKNIGSMKLSSVNSPSIQFTPPNYRTNELSIRDLKCPIVIMEPARKLDATFSKVIKLERHPGLGTIRTGDSRNNRKKDFWKKQTKADKKLTEKKIKCRGPYPLLKESNERPVINTVSPRMQHMKPDLKIKATATIPSYDLNKSPRQPEKSRLLESVSPRCKLRKKLNKLQDLELHNSVEQVNVKVNNCIEGKGKSILLQKNIQSSTVKVGTGAVLASEAKHPVILKDISTKEFNRVSSRRSCPNSQFDALLNQDGLLHSPVSVSTIFKAEYQNIPSVSNFTMECYPPTIPFTKSSRTDSAISESKDTAIQGSRVLRTTFNEVHIANAMFAPENQDNDRIIMAEKFQFRGLLQKESDLLSILEQKNCYKPSEFVQNTNPQKLHQKPSLDAMNQILAQEIDVASSGCPFEQMLNSGSFKIKHRYKELCAEVKCLRSCKDGNMDDKSMIHKDLIWNLQRWDSFKSELPMLDVEIERMIFKDLLNEVINGLTAVALDAKERRKRQVFEKDGM
ncbi:protein LONGIFOLIA 2-like [Phalaenopsis equestris]|uniref:protein LONGIFOLIA 2-like n=1 Tax=Phalaenopsis equestris TaxID=78828 RepID=UPI0009E32585|nr:protein LONGIFOLIA 2-like [Phalaenopsis equestris]